jgi:hypothetical protein
VTLRLTAHEPIFTRDQLPADIALISSLEWFNVHLPTTAYHVSTQDGWLQGQWQALVTLDSTSFDLLAHAPAVSIVTELEGDDCTIGNLGAKCFTLADLEATPTFIFEAVLDQDEAGESVDFVSNLIGGSHNATVHNAAVASFTDGRKAYDAWEAYQDVVVALDGREWFELVMTAGITDSEVFDISVDIIDGGSNTVAMKLSAYAEDSQIIFTSTTYIN